MKIVRRGALPVGGDSGLDEVRRRAAAGFGDGHAPRRDHAERRLGRLRRQGALVRRRRRDPPAAGRRRRRERHGRAMLPPVLERLPQLEVVACYFEPDGTFPNHEPNPLLAGEPRVHRRARRAREGADLGVAYDGDADRCFFVDDTGEFVPGRLRHGAARRGDAREGARRDGALRRARELGRAAHDRGGGRHRARQPRRPCVHQAPDARGGRASSPARSRRTTTSATSPRPTPASCRSCSCSS